MKIVAKTDKGLVRENNQDAYAVGELPVKLHGLLFVTEWAVPQAEILLLRLP